MPSHPGNRPVDASHILGRPRADSPRAETGTVSRVSRVVSRVSRVVSRVIGCVISWGQRCPRQPSPFYVLSRVTSALPRIAGCLFSPQFCRVDLRNSAPIPLPPSFYEPRPFPRTPAVSRRERSWAECRAHRAEVARTAGQPRLGCFVRCRAGPGGSQWVWAPPRSPRGRPPPAAPLHPWREGVAGRIATRHGPATRTRDS